MSSIRDDNVCIVGFLVVSFQPNTVDMMTSYDSDRGMDCSTTVERFGRPFLICRGRDTSVELGPNALTVRAIFQQMKIKSQIVKFYKISRNTGKDIFPRGVSIATLQLVPSNLCAIVQLSLRQLYLNYIRSEHIHWDDPDDEVSACQTADEIVRECS